MQQFHQLHHHIQYQSIRAWVFVRNRVNEKVDEQGRERGAELVQFLIIAAAVAALALVLLEVFETKTTDKINDLDLNQAPANPDGG